MVLKSYKMVDEPIGAEDLGSVCSCVWQSESDVCSPEGSWVLLEGWFDDSAVASAEVSDVGSRRIWVSMG